MRYSCYVFKEFPVNFKKLNKAYPYTIYTKDDTTNCCLFLPYYKSCPISIEILNEIYQYLLLEMWYVNGQTTKFFVEDWLNNHPQYDKKAILNWLHSYDINDNQSFINKIGVPLTLFLENSYVE